MMLHEIFPNPASVILVLVASDPKSEFRGDQFTRYVMLQTRKRQAGQLGNRPNFNKETLGTKAFSRNEDCVPGVHQGLGITHPRGTLRMANNQNDQNKQSGQQQKHQNQPQSGQQSGQQQRQTGQQGQSGQQNMDKDNQGNRSGQQGSGQQNK